MLGERRQLSQILFVLQRLFTSLLYQRVQQLRHLLVVFRVDGLLVDDDLTQVVLNGLGHRLFAIADTFGQFLHGIYSALNEQLHQIQIIERRNLLALFGADVGINQVSHRRLIHLEVDVVTARHLHLTTHLLVVVNFLLDFIGLCRGVARFGHLIGKVGIGANQRHGKFV